MAFAPVLMVFLGILQLCLIGAANLVVQTAAIKAARAAAVVLDDDPYYYDGEPRNILEFDVQSDDGNWMGEVGGLLREEGGAEWTTRRDTGEFSTEAARMPSSGSLRLKAIRRAAYLPLATISPEWDMVAGWFPMAGLFGDGVPSRYSVRRTGLGNEPMWRLVTGFLAYNLIASAVNFPDAPNSDEILNLAEDFDGTLDFNPRENVTVRVTYLMYCGVPLVNILMCDSFFSMTGIGRALDELQRLRDLELSDISLGQLREVRDALTNAWDAVENGHPEYRQALHELSGAEYGGYLYALLLAPRTYFHVIRREATLPIQKASYCYPTQDPCDR